MTKARCPIEEFCLKHGFKKCMFQRECCNDYKETCNFNRKLADGLRFKILDLDIKWEKN